MSNEQAKSELMQIYMSLSEEKKKALDMAFKAMEQADGEYISRQDAIKAIEEKAKRIKNEDTLNGLAGAIAILFDLPSYNSIKTELSGDLIQRQAVLEAIDVKAWEFCDYLISKNRNDEQKPVSHFADNLRECVREELPSVTPQESRTELKFCDRNICQKNEYNGIGCDECEVTKSQEPCENAISRQAVLDYIYNDLGLGDEENGKDVERQMELEDSYKYVKSLPPVNPQPKIERWIEEIDDYGEVIHWHCERCYEDSGFITTCKWNFCPNCGAKMD